MAIGSPRGGPGVVGRTVSLSARKPRSDRALTQAVGGRFLPAYPHRVSAHVFSELSGFGSTASYWNADYEIPRSREEAATAGTFGGHHRSVARRRNAVISRIVIEADLRLPQRPFFSQTRCSQLCSKSSRAIRPPPRVVGLARRPGAIIPALPIFDADFRRARRTRSPLIPGPGQSLSRTGGRLEYKSFARDPGGRFQIRPV